MHVVRLLLDARSMVEALGPVRRSPSRLQDRGTEMKLVSLDLELTKLVERCRNECATVHRWEIERSMREYAHTWFYCHAEIKVEEIRK